MDAPPTPTASRRVRRTVPSPCVRLVLAAILLSVCSASGPSAAREAVQMEIDGAIGPATASYVERGLDEARDGNAALVILRVDTPGGLDAAMRTIIRAILASPVPVAVHVAPSGARAASAGTYILYAAHIAAMAPGTNIGAATPIRLGGPGDAPPTGEGDGDETASEDDASQSRPPPDTATAKMVNDAVAYIRSLAELRGRNADWAETAVRSAASLSAQAALDRGVIDFVARDGADLLRKADGRTVTIGGTAMTLRTHDLTIRPLAPTWRETLLAVLTDPNIAYILMLVGVYGILFELINPGVVFPGIIGGICLLLGLFALNLLPIDHAGAGLMLLGIVLMVSEVFVASFGILGIGGMIAFAIGSLMLFDTAAPAFSLSPALIGIATAISAGFLMLVVAAVLRSRRGRVTGGAEAMIGAPGEVVRWTDGQGLVQVHGETWQARADRPLTRGARITVIGREKLMLSVEPESKPRPDRSPPRDPDMKMGDRDGPDPECGPDTARNAE